MLSILNNVAAVAAQNQMSITNANMQQTLQQLSSGKRINSGADDAAGLSIADELNANVAALTQSSQNATTGIGELQVADGALAQVTSLLNRAVTLATEAANSGLTADQHTALNNEFTAIKNEITSIGQTTTYNGTSIFGGSGTTNSNQVASGAINDGTHNLGAGNVGAAMMTGNIVVTAGGKTVDTFTATGGSSGESLTNFVNDINTKSVANGDGITASINTTTGELVLTDAQNRGDIAVSTSSTLATAAAENGGVVKQASESFTNTAATLVPDPNVLEGAAGISLATVVNAASGGGGGSTGTWDNNGGTTGDLGGGTDLSTTVATMDLDDSVRDGSTVFIGGTQYTFKTALDGTANEIKIVAGNTAATLGNLKDAINGVNNNGTEYSAGTASDSDMTTSAITAGPDGFNEEQLTFTAKTAGGATIDSAANGNIEGAWFWTFNPDNLVPGTNLAPASATLTLTSNLSTASTLDIGNTNYTFVANGTDTTGHPTEIALGLTTADTTTAIIQAVNTNSGDTSVIASPTGADQITFTARTAGSAGNSLAATGNLIAAAGGSTQTLTVNAGGRAYDFSVAAGATVNDVINTINHQGTPISASLDPTTGKLLLTDTQDHDDISVSDSDGGVLVNNLAGGPLGDSTDTFSNPDLSAANSVNVFLSDSSGEGTSSVSVALAQFDSANLGVAGQGISQNDLTTTTDAATALTAINTAISNVSALRGNIGAGVNQLQAATNVMSSQTQNLTTASSNITSADVSVTVADMTKYSILSQTGMAAMAQANQMQKGILTLLQG